MKTATAITVGLIIGLLSGVGAFALAVAGDVKGHGVQIDRLQKDFEFERTRTDQRIFEAVGVSKEVLAVSREVLSANRELSAQIRTQNELMRDRKP